MTTLGSALAFTLYVGAAHADATPDQVYALRATVFPRLDEYRRTGDEAPVRRAIAAVMGDEWRPSGKWAAQIAALSGDRDG